MISRAILGVLILTIQVAVACPALGRVWKDKTGKFEIEAEAIAFSNELVVLKKPTGDLVAVAIDELSEDDQEYIKSKETEDELSKSADETQTWTARDGMKVRGRVVEYGREPMRVQRRFGRVEINGKRFSELEPLHQRVVLKIISHLERTKIGNQSELEEWAKRLGAEPKIYELEGVRLELESGDVVEIPFFMFAEKELELLKPGWERWLEETESEKERERESFLMRSEAMAYQQNQAMQRRIEMLKLDMLATTAGVISIWEVLLIPKQGRFMRPMRVVVPASNSRLARQIAQQRYPAYVAGSARRASN